MTKRAAWKQDLATHLNVLLPRSNYTYEDFLRVVDELDNIKAIQRPEHSDARELCDALQPGPNDQIVDAVLIGKMVDFDTRQTGISIAVTDGVDWVSQYGMLYGALNIIDRSAKESRDD
jgi:hypothetical protein